METSNGEQHVSRAVIMAVGGGILNPQKFRLKVQNGLK